ncbi:MAG: preprotein translocase subunit SecE [Clostridia bacterium]|nr:preprotein translocase subunit SecE [Clostridia bacterium]
MAKKAKKKNFKPTNKPSELEVSENSEIEKSEEVLTEVKTKKDKADKTKAKEDKNNKKSAKKKAKNNKPRRNFVKEIFSELKKVSWPTFGQTLAKTGTVIVVVAIFMVVVLGIDVLLTWLVSLLVA